MTAARNTRAASDLRPARRPAGDRDPRRCEARLKTYGSLAVLRPDQPDPPGDGPVHLRIAQREAESFQCLIRPQRAITIVDVSVTVPGANTKRQVYRQEYINISEPSGDESDTGLYPDALIPKRDIFYGETRNAFPVSLQAGEQLAVWVDVYVPQGTPPGVYKGDVAVRRPGRVDHTPITVEVLPFSIPATSSLRSIFGVGGEAPAGIDQTLFAAGPSGLPPAA